MSWWWFEQASTEVTEIKVKRERLKRTGWLRLNCMSPTRDPSCPLAERNDQYSAPYSQINQSLHRKLSYRELRQFLYSFSVNYHPSTTASLWLSLKKHGAVVVEKDVRVRIWKLASSIDIGIVDRQKETCNCWKLCHKHSETQRTNINKDRWQSNKGSRAKPSVARGDDVCMCMCWGVIEMNGVRSEGAIRTMEGSKEGGGKSWEPVLVCPASPELTLRRCLIRPVNLRDWGHPGTLIRPDGSTVPRQMSAIFTPFIHLSKHTHIITSPPPPSHTHTVPNVSSFWRIICALRETNVHILKHHTQTPDFFFVSVAVYSIWATQ